MNPVQGTVLFILMTWECFIGWRPMTLRLISCLC